MYFGLKKSENLKNTYVGFEKLKIMLEKRINKNTCCGTAATIKLPDCAISGKDEKHQTSHLKRSSEICISLSPLGESKDERTKRWYKGCGYSSTNNSTLSLHIAAYENSTEAVAFVDGFDKYGAINKKQVFNISSTFVIENPFEFPRQEESVCAKIPEVSQFKASQQLLNYNPKINNILNILVSKHPLHGATSVYSDGDYLAADFIEKQIQEIVKTGKIPHSYYDLDIKSDMLDDSSESDDSQSEDVSDSEYLPGPNQSKPLPYSLDVMKEILNLYDDKRFSGNKLKRVTKRFRFIKNKMQIHRIREQLRNQGSRQYKIRELDRQLFELFCRWKNQKQVVRDRFLIDAAFEIADKLQYKEFKASDSWLLMFKKRHRIVGRKVTQFITMKEPKEQENIVQMATTFVKNAKQTIENKSPSKVFNSDQMGIQLEMTSGRTLAFKGEKKIEAVVQNKNATTQTLTIQPLINAAGELFVPVLTCFHEQNGPPHCFETDLGPYKKNLQWEWSRSGKVDKSMMKKWMKNNFLKVADKNSVLLLDSWPGFKEAKLIPELGAKKIHILTIPPKTTGIVQPLDVGFNRYFKAVYRTMSDKIRRLHPDFKLAQRANIGLLLYQTIEQIRAPRYRSLIAHAFIKPGYFDHQYEPYETPDSYCFEFKKLGARCQTTKCGKLAFIRCSWCEKFYCFEHFLIQQHSCSN